MKTFILLAAVIIFNSATAQNNTAANIIEGGKTLVELVRVFKTPKYIMPPQQAYVEKKDSCSIKDISDLCIRNNTVKPLLVSLYKRNGNGYDATVLTMNILPKNQECLYELKSGIYKMKLETEEDEVRKTFREGEIKLTACSNQVKEINN